jgi:hypothetical protein
LDRLSNILKQRLEAGQLAPVEHPSVDMLTAFVERALKGPERDVVVSHLSVCPTCRKAVILALPEIANEKAQAASASSSVRFRLPTAMRWVSVAAAFAVTVGVGILSYEHESGRQPARILIAPVAPQQVARDSVQGNVQPKKAKIEAGPAKSKMDLEDGLMARDPAPGRKVLQKKAATRGYETHAKQPSSEAGIEQNQPDIANGFVMGRKTLSAAEYAKSVPAPTTPEPSAAAQMVEVEPAQQTKPAPAGATQSLQVTAAAPGITGGLVQSSPKSFNGIALGGPMFRKSLARSNEIVHWTISSAGKLLREAQNGAKRLIEPAPGLTVRAVAAKGIEVWAGGVQPDTSAAQWQQRPVLFHSSDAGETWTKVDGPWTAPITRLDLVSDDALTVSAEDGTWSTTDAGKSWVKQ